MLDHNYCKKILEEEGEKYSDEEVKMIVDLLQQFAAMNIELFEKINREKNEESDFDGEG